MKRPNLGGMTAVAALVLAIGAGAVGGVMAVSGAAPSPVAPTQDVRSVSADEVAAPEPAVVPSIPAPAAVVEEAPAPAKAPVSEPAPIVGPVAPKGETAQQAADRATTEADRAKLEADRAKVEAEKAAATPAPAPAPAPAVVTPAPQPETKPVVEVSGPTSSGFKQQWQVAEESQAEAKASPAPAP